MGKSKMLKLYLDLQPGVELAQVQVHEPTGDIKVFKPNDPIECYSDCKIVLRALDREYAWNVITPDNEVRELGCTPTCMFYVPSTEDAHDAFLFIDMAREWPAHQCNIVLKNTQGWAHDINPILDKFETLELKLDVRDSSYIYKIRQYCSFGKTVTYKPTDTIKCYAGDSITLFHASNKHWVTNGFSKNDYCNDLGLSTFCSFDVPTKVKGTKATLVTGSSHQSYDYLALNKSVGWVRDVIPRIGL